MCASQLQGDGRVGVFRAASIENRIPLCATETVPFKEISEWQFFVDTTQQQSIRSHTTQLSSMGLATRSQSVASELSACIQELCHDIELNWPSAAEWYMVEISRALNCQSRLLQFFFLLTQKSTQPWLYIL